MSWLPFVATLYAPFIDYGAKSYDFKREKIIEEEPLKIYQRDDNTKYAFLKKRENIKKQPLRTI